MASEGGGRGSEPHREDIEAASAGHASVELCHDVTDMPALMEWCDIAISAGGSTVWEFCFFGVPVLLVSIAENQNGIVREMGRSGAGIDLGLEEHLDLGNMVERLADLLENDSRREAMSECARRLVDAAGADRAAAALDGRLRLAIATADGGWVKDMLEAFVGRLEAAGHDVSIVHEADSIPEGDVAFFLSFWSLVPAATLKRNTHNLVVHASDLPRGKGWSPMTWQVLEGANEIPVTLFEAQPAVDSGDIYYTQPIRFEGHELLPELRVALMEKSYALCERFVADYPLIASRGREQEGEESFYPRRGPDDSRIDPGESIASQFELLRTVDNESYPAFFEYRGQRYKLAIEKANDDAE